MFWLTEDPAAVDAGVKADAVLAKPEPQSRVLLLILILQRTEPSLYVAGGSAPLSAITTSHES